MKPQNKVTIFMIVMIVMLSIYYFALPDNKPGEDNPPCTGDSCPVSKSEEFTILRNTLKDTRQTIIQDLYNYIGTDVNPDQVKEAQDAIAQLNNLTQNETMLEAELLLAGYFDVFVDASQLSSTTTDTDDNPSVIVYVYTDQLSATEVINVMDKAKVRFGEYTNVIIDYGYEVN